MTWHDPEDAYYKNTGHVTRAPAMDFPTLRAPLSPHQTVSSSHWLLYKTPVSRMCSPVACGHVLRASHHGFSQPACGHAHRHPIKINLFLKRVTSRLFNITSSVQRDGGASEHKPVRIHRPLAAVSHWPFSGRPWTCTDIRTLSVSGIQHVNCRENSPHSWLLSCPRSGTENRSLEGGSNSNGTSICNSFPVSVQRKQASEIMRINMHMKH